MATPTGKGPDQLPRMTSAQITALTGVQEGWQVFNTTTNEVWTYNGTVWIAQSVTSQNFQYAASDGVSTTSSATYQQKLRMTTPVLPAGDYLIQWQAEIMIDDENSDIQTRVQADDATTITEQTGRLAERDLWYIRGGFGKVTLTNAAHNIDLDYNNQSGKTLSIRRARLTIQRVTT